MSTRFMIVDDTKFMRSMLTDILVKQEFEVVGEADNGAKAIQLYKELQPDVVFMDISMPEMDGIEAMRQIRDINPKAVVIICSGISQQYLISDAMKMGADGYVMKPFKPKQIKEVVQKYALHKVAEARSFAEASGKAKEAPEEAPADTLGKPESAETAGHPGAAEPSVRLEPSEIAELTMGFDPALAEEERAEPSAVQEDEPEAEPLGDIAGEAAETGWEEVAAVAEVDLPDIDPEPAPLPDQALSADFGALAEAQRLSPEPDPEPLPDLQVLPEESTVTDETAAELPDIYLLEEEAASDEPPMFLNDGEAMSEEDELQAKSVADIIPLHHFKTMDRSKEESAVKEFTSSISCRWKEDIGDREVYYNVVCYEGENRVHIEFQGQDEGPAIMSFEGLRSLMNWIESKAKPMSNPTIEAVRRS